MCCRATVLCGIMSEESGWSRMATASEPLRPLWAELDFDALAHNLAIARGLDRAAAADRLGQGQTPMATAPCRSAGNWRASACETLWTGSIDEARAKRAAGIGARLLLSAATCRGYSRTVAAWPDTDDL
jgi:hypothetical protein